ncbi:MAG: SUMF1/EgtB/PvdO family nonheme iron enzyme [Candidatus Wallbacteria bacterium]|nr:SUMF1/EgtB/PvdO family nonheme iron enzyme [Candidatus Wallbacteria bacterium]
MYPNRPANSTAGDTSARFPLRLIAIAPLLAVALSAAAPLAAQTDFAVDVERGLNLISLPFDPGTTTASYTAEDLRVDLGASFVLRTQADAVHGASRPQVHLPGLTSPFDIEGSDGYLIAASKTRQVPLRGRPWPASSRSRTVARGVNLLGAPDGTPGGFSSDDLMALLGANTVARIEAGRFRVSGLDLGELFYLRPGRGVLVLGTGATREASMPAETSNRVPVVVLAPVESASVNRPLPLDASNSFDPDGDGIVAFEWQQVSGPAAGLIDGPSRATATFTAPQRGDYRLVSSARDARGGSGRRVLGLKVEANAPPRIVVAPLPPAVVVGRSLALDAGASIDPQGQLLTYAWSIASGPAAGLNQNGPVAILTPAAPGSLLLRLQVANSTSLSTAQVRILAVPNSAPVARAPANLQVTAGSQVFLDGGSSSDSEGDPLSYNWRLVFGPAAPGLESPGSRVFGFTATTPGDYGLELTVGDPDGLSSTASVAVTVISTLPGAGPRASVDSATSGPVSLELPGTAEVEVLQAPDTPQLSTRLSVQRTDGSSTPVAFTTGSASVVVGLAPLGAPADGLPDTRPLVIDVDLPPGAGIDSAQGVVREEIALGDEVFIFEYPVGLEETPSPVLPKTRRRVSDTLLQRARARVRSAAQRILEEGRAAGRTVAQLKEDLRKVAASVKQRAQSSLAELERRVTVVVLQDSLCVDKGTSLRPLDTLEMGERSPVVLIHGYQGEEVYRNLGSAARALLTGVTASAKVRAEANKTGLWDGLRGTVEHHRYLESGGQFLDLGSYNERGADPAAQARFEALQRRYKFYYYLWPTCDDLERRGEVMAADVKREILDRGARAGRELIVIAHSAGGLVSRFAMNKEIAPGVKLGERVRYLVTLATPHHGTFAASLLDYLESPGSSLDPKKALVPSGLATILFPPGAGRRSLVSDNADGLIGARERFLGATVNERLKVFNAASGSYDEPGAPGRDRYRDRIVALFGGEADPYRLLHPLVLDETTKAELALGYDCVDRTREVLNRRFAVIPAVECGSFLECYRPLAQALEHPLLSGLSGLASGLASASLVGCETVQSCVADAARAGVAAGLGAADVALTGMDCAAANLVKSKALELAAALDAANLLRRKTELVRRLMGLFLGRRALDFDGLVGRASGTARGLIAPASAAGEDIDFDGDTDKVAVFTGRDHQEIYYDPDVVAAIHAFLESKRTASEFTAPQITTTNLTGAVASQSYRVMLAASGSLPIVWGLAPGSQPLPQGLTLTAAGELTGTVPQPLTATFTVRAANGGGRDDRSLTLTVSPTGGGGGEGLTPLVMNAQGFMEYVNEKDGSVLIEIPAGSFTMGSTQAQVDALVTQYGGQNFQSEVPQHTVMLSTYLIGKYEVTNAQYRAFLAATADPKGPTQHQGHHPNEGASKNHTPGDWDSTAYSQYSDADASPVIILDWYDSYAYCAWAGLALPTEAQWEQAARGTAARTYPWGNELANAENVYRANYYAGTDGSDDGFRYTAPVESFGAGALSPRANGTSPVGALDMLGNVWEWCFDWYDPSYYGQQPEWSDPTGPLDARVHRCIRGGGWSSNSGSDVLGFLRTSARGNQPPTSRFGSPFSVGFRVAR